MSLVWLTISKALVRLFVLVNVKAILNGVREKVIYVRFAEDILRP